MSEADGWYHHPPGAPSRWAVLDVGLFCPHSCQHCFYVHMDGHEDAFHGMRHAKFHSTDWLKRVVVALKKSGFRGFDVSGGEPTAHPGLREVVQGATEQGLATRIITLGQFLLKHELLERLLDAGLCDIEFSHHAHTEDLFQGMTGGSLAKQLAAMDVLEERDFPYCTNTTITEKNFRALPKVALGIAERPNIYVANFLQLMPLYKWSTTPEIADGVQPRFADVYPYLKEAVAIVTAAGKAVNIRYSPMCSVRGMERHMAGIVGVRYDAHEWTNNIDHYASDEADPEIIGSRMNIRPGDAPGAELFMMDGQGGLIAGRGNPAAPTKVFTQKCAGCSALRVCDGIDRNYLAKHGDGEFQPYDGPSRGVLLDQDRLNYGGVFTIKVSGAARLKGNKEQ